ncbi:MAG: SLOG family protein [Hyphomicrobium sp.]
MRHRQATTISCSSASIRRLIPKASQQSGIWDQYGMSLRVLVCGGRMYANRNRIFEVLSALHRERGIEIILHGAASGADLLVGCVGG